MSKPTTSFRLDPRLVKKARDMDLDLTAILEAAIAVATRTHRCPYCKSVIKPTSKTD